MSRYVCIHGHFYQPPRENPWLGEVEFQDSAKPYHDWNEKVTAECYAPNSAARVLDKDKFIIDIVNNYALMSFNFGPTLLSWLEIHAPDVYRAVLQADRMSRERFSGHGAALAQAYNHMIMPLANFRDKQTQIVWGIADFKHRFKREPAGLWLPETAVDLETLDIMAELGIKFTILSPYQAERIRKIGDDDWTDVRNGRLDSRRPYLCILPSGRRIHLFFFDWALSHDIAFGDLLESGSGFARRLLEVFSDAESPPQLVNVASDGETYGHHHRFADMALAFCIREIETESPALITIYGEFLEKHTARYQVDIIENTSWSCNHGVERWRANCGCSTGKYPPGNQAWRAPLREAMDWLRERSVAFYDREMATLLDDPWKARDAYISVVLDRSRENAEAFFSKQASRELSRDEKRKTLKLLEMQRQAMLMYTSCGWFFDEVSRIETVQVMRYAGRVMDLLREIGGADLEPGFVARLEKAPSNVPGLRNGARVYEKFVKTAMSSLFDVGVQHGLSSFYRRSEQQEHTGHHTVRRLSQDFVERGEARLSMGKSLIRDELTLDEETVCYAALEKGYSGFSVRVNRCPDEKDYVRKTKAIIETFKRNDFTETLRLMEANFDGPSYSWRHLSRDEKRRVLNQVSESALNVVATSLKKGFESHRELVQSAKESRLPLPEPIVTAAGLMLNWELRLWAGSSGAESERLQKLARDYKQWNCEPDEAILNILACAKVDSLLQGLSRKPEDKKLARDILKILNVLMEFPAGPDLWHSQNTFYALWRSWGKNMQKQAEKGDASAIRWLAVFRDIGTRLKVKCA